MAKKSPKSLTKTEILNEIAERTELSKKQVGAVFDELGDLIGGQLGKKGPGVFTIPGLVKLRTRIKPAVPAGMRRNPFTGEEKMMPAKPASRTVKATPLKKLKDMV
mgnify:FL=1